MTHVRTLFTFLTILGTTTTGFAQTHESSSEPQLGPVVHLASLEFDADQRSVSLTEPQLGPIVRIATLDAVAALPQKGDRPLATVAKSESKHNGEGVSPRFEAKQVELPPAPTATKVHQDFRRLAQICPNPGTATSNVNYNVVFTPTPVPSATGQSFQQQSFVPFSVPTLPAPPSQYQAPHALLVSIPPIEPVLPMIPGPGVIPGQGGLAPHPDAIHHQLLALTEQFIAAGLHAEADQLREFQQKFYQDHHQRLLIAFKQSQIQVLQAEIDALSRFQQMTIVSVDAPRAIRSSEASVAIKCRIVQMKLSDDTEAFLKQTSAVSNAHEQEQILKSIEQLCQRGLAKMIAEPSATVLSGRTMNFQYGQDCDSSQITCAGQSNSQERTYRGPGLTITATPDLTGPSRVRVAIVAENRVEKSEPGQDSAPQFLTRRISSVVELNSKQTCMVVLDHLIPESSQSDDSKCYVLVLTPEVVVQENQDPQYQRMKPVAVQPVPGSIRGRSFVIEAKATSQE